MSKERYDSPAGDDFKKDILQCLIRKYQRRAANHNQTNRRIAMSPKELYRDYHENNSDISVKERLNQAADELECQRMITIERLKYSDEIRKIYLREDTVSSIYELLEREYGVTPRDFLKGKVQLMMDAYSHGDRKTNSKTILNYYSKTLRRQMENPSYEIDPAHIEANLKMLAFLESNKEEIYTREASMLVYGDSKWFQENNYDEICNIIRGALGLPEKDGEPKDGILDEFHLMPNEQDIFIRGQWKIKWHDTEIDTAGLKGGISLSSADIADIKRVSIEAPALMTIENHTSFQRMKAAGVAYMYLGGFASRFQLAFLKKVIADNPRITYMHFGDIDAGGFWIHRQLCEVSGKDFQMYQMGIEQLADKRFASCLKPLTDNDMARLRPFAEMEPYRETVSYMLEHNVKLEQEIISYFLYK